MSTAPILAKTLRYKLKLANSEKILEFDKPVITIGRGPENDVALINDARVSRTHAAIRIDQGRLIVRNVSSKNSLYVNGKKEEESVLRDGSVLLIGDTQITVSIEGGSSPVPSPVSVVAGGSNQASPLMPGAAPQPVAEAIPIPVIARDGEAPAALAPNSQAPLAPAPERLGIAKEVPLDVLKPTSKNPLSPLESAKVPPRNLQRGPAGMPPASPRPRALGEHQDPYARQAGYAQSPKPKFAPADEGGKKTFYMIVAVIVIGAMILMSGEGSKKKTIEIRSDAEVERDLEMTAVKIQELMEQKKKRGEDSIGFRQAEEYYLKGFRDYQQGQYSRAILSFQSALSLYPGHVLATKYKVEAERKQEELIDFNMRQGRRYYGRRNYRLCMAHFGNVLVMIKDTANRKYVEAKNGYNLCQVASEGND